MLKLLDHLHWRFWFYPGPQRVFTPEEMARAGMQRWPVAVDSYVAINLLVLLPAMLATRRGASWQTQVLWWGALCALAVVSLLVARSL